MCLAFVVLQLDSFLKDNNLIIGFASVEYVGKSWVKGAEENSADIQAKSWDMTIKYHSYLFSLIVVLSLSLCPWEEISVIFLKD